MSATRTSAAGRRNFQQDVALAAVQQSNQRVVARLGARETDPELAQKARATYRTQPQAARHVAEIDAWLAGKKS